MSRLVIHLTSGEFKLSHVCNTKLRKPRPRTINDPIKFTNLLGAVNCKRCLRKLRQTEYIETPSGWITLAELTRLQNCNLPKKFMPKILQRHKP